MDRSHTETGKGSILIVGDDRSARGTLSALMEAEGYAVRCAPSGQTALLLAREELPELILLDVRLPDGDGFEVCRRLKVDARTRGIPVIFLSALEDATDRIKGFTAGGADYIPTPFDGEEVLARVRTHVALHRLQSDLERRVEERTAALHRSEDTLKERLRFETLLSELSAKFVSVAADQVDSEIENAQRRICELLDVDRSTLWQVCEGEPGTLVLTHLYRPQESLPPPERMDARVFLP